MRLCRFLKRRIIVFIVLLIVLLLLIRQVFIEKQRISITNEIIIALGSRNTSEQVKVNISTTIINSQRCRPNSDQNSLLAVVVVTSMPHEVQDRINLRAQWHRWDGNFKNVQLIFFVGLPKDNNIDNIQSESLLYDDIIMESMKESYYSLTLKTLRILKWFLSNCSNIKYLIKSDMDTFIHLPNMINYLNSIEKKGIEISNKFIGGDIAVHAHPIYDPTNKWYMPPELLETVHLDEKSPYPNYVLGGFYVLSSALIPSLFSQSLKVPLIQFEDVFLTGIIANRDLGINLSKIPNVYSTKQSHLGFLFTSYPNNSIVACHLEGDMSLMNRYFKYYQSLYSSTLKIKSDSSSRSSSSINSKYI